MRTESLLQQQESQNLRKAMAVELAREYCKKHGYAPEKLQSQRYLELPSCVCFAQPSDVKQNGLMNDKETMPLPTLVLKLIDGKLTFEVTEHTDKYLKD